MVSEASLARAGLLAAALSVPATAGAQPWINEGFYYRNLTLARLNPRGLFDEFRAGYRHRLSTRARPILQNTYLGLSGHLTVSPAFVRPGVSVEFQPLAVVQLSASYEHTQYFGNFDLLQSFPSPASEHSDTVLAAGGRRGQGYAAADHRVTLGVLLQARVEALVLRSQSRFVYIDASLRGGDPVFYDIWYDLMAADRGWLYANDTDLLVSIPEMGFHVGLRYSLVHALYPDAAFPQGEPVTQPNGPTQRLGPILAYTFSERRRGAFNGPTLIAIVNWWLAHRYRTGADVDAAIPYVVVGLSFRGD